MEASFPIPQAIQDFLALKPSCPQMSLLPCIYTDFEEMQLESRSGCRESGRIPERSENDCRDRARLSL
ncbi:MAG: hypothetical protein Q4A72_02250 [Bacillota bacterium]|nr:hypothetical protein [Bacillota bacterium]